jgi:flagellar hook-associated protein 3 FlgL
VGGAFTFSNSNTPPTAATATTAPGTLSFTGKFQGTEDIVSIEINKALQLPIGVSGGVTLRGGTPPGSSGVDIIKTLDTLIADIKSDNKAGIAAANTALDTVNQQMLGFISDVSMRKSRMDNALVAQQRSYNILSGIHDDLQNVDMAAAAISLTDQKNAFEAALAATAKVTQLSLLNYM